MSTQSPRNVPPRRIDEEIVCIDSCRHLLITRCGASIPRPFRVDNDPPDFEMSVDDHIYSVEVTSIAMSATIARHSQADAFQRLVRRRAIEKGILFGTYAIAFTHNIRPPRQNSEDARQLLTAALTYVGDTKDHNESLESTLLTDKNGGTIAIEKLDSQGAKIIAASFDASQWGGETVTEVAALIQRRVDEKIRTLANHNVDAANTLLLLYDAHGYADPEMIRVALGSVSDYTAFHSIYVVASFTERTNDLSADEPGRKGFFAFSRNDDWRGKSTATFG